MSDADVFYMEGASDGRRMAIEECARVTDAAYKQVREEYTAACNDVALSETGRESILERLSAQADAAESIANQIRHLAVPE